MNYNLGSSIYWEKEKKSYCAPIIYILDPFYILPHLIFMTPPTGLTSILQIKKKGRCISKFPRANQLISDSSEI